MKRGRRRKSHLWTANLTPAPAAAAGWGFRLAAETAPESPTSRPGRSRRGHRAGRRFRRPARPPAAIWPRRECRPIGLPAAEQLNRQIGIRIRHHILERPGDAVGPVRRSEHRRQRHSTGAPSMIAWFMRNQATPSPARASMASMNQGRPCAACRVRTGNRVGSAASPAGSAKPGHLDRAFARQRHPHGGAGLVLVGRPQRVVDHADAAAFASRQRVRFADPSSASAAGTRPTTRSPCPICRWSASASTSAVSRLATAPPCRPAKGPAASGVGCQRLGAERVRRWPRLQIS